MSMSPWGCPGVWKPVRHAHMLKCESVQRSHCPHAHHTSFPAPLSMLAGSIHRLTSNSGFKSASRRWRGQASEVEDVGSYRSAIAGARSPTLRETSALTSCSSSSGSLWLKPLTFSSIPASPSGHACTQGGYRCTIFIKSAQLGLWMPTEAQ